MSLKDNVDFVKKELDSEEKFIESFVKVERFYKKYKKALIAAVAVIVVGSIGYTINNSIQASNKAKANLAFNKILNDVNDQEALATLKSSNDKLYNVALYLQAKEGNKNIQVNERYLKYLLEYEEALKNSDVEKLNSLAMQKDFLLKEFALFNKALILTEQGKFEDARQTLKMIKQDSKVSDLVALLNHYLLTK
ncbi:tetratricopeptide repeat protein [Candidatus Marinarcus aquaticus]|uniref:Uncharacterized protein n=1 Tax=Candidatus Marinarcus aquaticus TaxID=2044504 RepID=A0A4Q0XNX9_9BACT|nr:tetratricopeptide repeat protein [Candidatus Marinarcus aquaticus]RXJ54463.1 hypothetical protein CRV04_11770 [Candidatus Marinarcus aquaticus]